MCRKLVSLSAAIIVTSSLVANAQVMTGVYRRNPNALISPGFVWNFMLDD